MVESEHDCQWRRDAVLLEARLAEKDAQLAVVVARLNELEQKLALAMKQILGPKSERIPTPEQEAKAREGKKPRGGHTNPAKRKENAEAMSSLPAVIIHHPVPAEERRCPHCGDEIKSIGSGDESVEYEWIPGRIERRVHVVEVGRCPCKQHYARGPAPARVQEGCTYGPGFLAKLAVDKCADAIPIYRIEKAMRRSGIPLSRSTMNDLILLAADVCMPLYEAGLAALRVDPHVQADETSCRTQTRSGRSFIWTFLSKEYTLYVFSASRSGDVPKEVLGGTTGTITVDGYTGYNVIADVDGRERTGCWSHARRHLFDALQAAPEAREGLDIILELFMVERKAMCQQIVGTSEHLALRRRRSAPVLERLREWRETVAPLFEPKSAMGQALGYMKNQWSRLSAFIDDAMIPIHNNASEAALRIIALMRKNSLFFGNDEAGRRFMVLYSLIATCERHDINPEVYLTDILIRIHDHPKSRIDELLPHRWKERYGSGFTVDRVITPAGAT